MYGVNGSESEKFYGIIFAENLSTANRKIKDLRNIKEYKDAELVNNGSGV